jgi:tetratricopeptide (TPR) repeat protein
MMFRIAAVAILAAWLPPASAQTETASDQLQKAIYTHETMGDLDAAIQSYRQIVASNPGNRAVAVQAQYKLFQALMQKGDFNGAQIELQKLVISYPDDREFIMSLAGRMRRGPSGPSITLGTLKNGRYHHNLTGIEFNTPSGWKLIGDSDSSDNGQIVMFANQKQDLSLQVWIRPDVTAAADIPSALRHDLERKHEDRMQGWVIRPSSITMRTVGGQQAISGVADFQTDVIPAAMVEYVTWVRSTKGKAFFFGAGPVEQASELQSAFEQLLAGAMVP